VNVPNRWTRTASAIAANTLRSFALGPLASRSKGRTRKRRLPYGEITESTHGRKPGTLTSLALSRERQTRKALAELGLPPESAATARQAVQAAILKFLPTSEAVAIKEDDLFAMLNVPSRGTARNALMGLLKAGKIGRVGQGVSGDPFRYFKRDSPERAAVPRHS
jgi:hypothetical protein